LLPTIAGAVAVSGPQPHLMEGLLRPRNRILWERSQQKHTLGNSLTPPQQVDMPLSAGSLFHFTSTIDNLIGILEGAFRPRLSVEDFALVKRHFRSAEALDRSGIPMVCFCDIRLSQVQQPRRPPKIPHLWPPQTPSPWGNRLSA